MLIYKDWEMSFYDVFNEAFQSYLNNISPTNFLNIFLERIIKITGSKSGFIASLNKMDGKNFLSFEAVTKNIFVYEEMSVPGNLLLDIDDRIDSIYSKCVLQNKVIIFPNADSAHEKYHLSLFDNKTNITTCICIPFGFNEELTGIFTLANRSSYEQDMIPTFKILSNLIGFLQNSYFKMKKTTLETDNRFMTYQLYEHIANLSRDGTIVTTISFNILFINESALNIISINNPSSIQSATPSSNIDSDIIKLFPKLDILNQNSVNKLFRNRRIMTDAIEFLVNSVISHNKIYHIFFMYPTTPDNNNITTSLNSMYSTNFNSKKHHTNFIAYLSHELRNPLQSINLANHLLQYDLQITDTSDQKISTYLKTITRSCHEMKKIINDILDLNKIEAHEFIIDFDLCNIRELCDTIYNEFLPLANEKSLTLTLDVHDYVPKTIYTDEVRLCQILSNLLSNALKYSKSGEIKLRVVYENNDNNNNREHGIKFIIIDNGEGIRKDDLPNLFRQFSQTSCSDKFNSNGLGLCVSQKIAYLLGGCISVMSEHKKGSTFTMFHPITLGTSGVTFIKNKFNKNLTGNLLIVDDNESNLLLFRLMLDHFNCEYKYNLEIHTVKDGKDAIDICKDNVYDIIFMDINMPGIDGCTASRIIKHNGFKGKIIATTGNILAKKENLSVSKDKDKYKYFDDVIIKPYDDSLVLQILNEYLF